MWPDFFICLWSLLFVSHVNPEVKVDIFVAFFFCFNIHFLKYLKKLCLLSQKMQNYMTTHWLRSPVSCTIVHSSIHWADTINSQTFSLLILFHLTFWGFWGRKSLMQSAKWSYYYFRAFKAWVETVMELADACAVASCKTTDHPGETSRF